MWSCYPGGPQASEEQDVALSYYDDQFNFADVRTYAMPDEVFLREGSADVDTRLNDHILGEVARNMAQKGYVRENNPQQNGADVVVLVSVSRSTTTWGGWTPGWGWWGGWYPGWGMWYPCPVVGTFTTGTVFIEFIYGGDIDPDADEIPVRWAGIVTGVLSGSSVTAERITRGIDQCFDQSPYLGDEMRESPHTKKG